MNLHTQWMTVMLMLMSGLALGLVFDSYRVVAGQFKFPRWTLPVFDLLYWLAATVFVFQMLVKGNQGELRFYVVLGLAAGAWLYAVFLSRITVAIVKWLVTALKAVWRFAMRCVHVLVVLPLKAILTGGKALTFFFISSAMFLLKIVLQCLRPLWMLIAWLFKPLVMPLWNRFGMTERCKSTWRGMISAGKRISAWPIGVCRQMRRFLDLFRRKR
ncbi:MULTISPECIES: spore cortex biosynthesis protein YabQ [Paenibacillus]|nr:MULTISPECIES: spore cortex biosynthesis protein YabQ [Paenibacillus]MCY9705433.1 spore cortex biosynthesis protein YabQ [Paenibacillus alvei]MEC0083116.1 spore cortex biosynthesis protein YabQ [Paenibacillus alvei]